MKFAQARELITPHIRTKMSGYGSRTENFKGIHDDFYVKVAYMENKDTKLMFITYDLVHYLYDLNERVMQYASENYDIPYNNIIISYSHTHAGPKITSPTEKDTPSPLDSFFEERTKTCIDRAFLNVFEGTLHMARTSGRWNINRRRVTDNGIALAPNYENITDDEVVLLTVKDMDNNIKSIFVNYSCHPVTLAATLYLSSEFPGRMCNILESRFYGSMAFFLQGAAGNMRPLITAEKDKFKPCTFNELDEFATSIANEVSKTICKGNFKSIEPEFKCIKFNIYPKIEPLTKEFFQNKVDESHGFAHKRLKHTLDNFNSIDDFAVIHSGIAALTPDLYIAYMGGEICYELKLIIKEAFKPADVIFLGYHEALTYIPDDKIIKEGGYEGFEAPLYAGFRGPFKNGINDTVYQAFKDNIREL